MTSTTPASAKKTAQKRHKRYAKFALATVGLLGVGAALTSATWTDDVWFTTDTSAATVDLQGSANGTDWLDVRVDGTDGSTPIVIDSAEFENLLPGDVRTITVHLRNAGTTNLAIAMAETPFEFTGGFATALSTSDVSATFAATELAPEASTTLVVTVTVPDPWAETNMGATGTLLVAVTGTGTH